MSQCQPSRISMDPNNQLYRQTGTLKVDPQLYCSLVSSLIYVTNICLNVSYAVNCVSCYFNAPEQAHLQAAKQILRYLTGIQCHIMHCTSLQLILIDFVPSLMRTAVVTLIVTDLPTTSCIRLVTPAYYGPPSYGPLYPSWTEAEYRVLSKLQPTLSLLTIEAEYRVLSKASKDIAYLRQLLNELDILISHGRKLLPSIVTTNHT